MITSALALPRIGIGAVTATAYPISYAVTVSRLRTFARTGNGNFNLLYHQLRNSTSTHHFNHHKSSYSFSLTTQRFLSVTAHKSVKPTQQCRSRDDTNQKKDTNFGTSILERRHRTVLYYLCAVAILVAGASYAAVPLYRIFCRSYSYGGTVATHSPDRNLSKMKKVKNRELTIRFNADKSSSLQWSFVPRQSEIILYPGETALAFYTAKNSTNRPIDGISTYNVIPYEVGQYFNKIQCFCFEEQRLNPGETVELPVFFYIDPEFSNDPKMEDVDTILLSYTFFEAKEVPKLNLPSLSSLKLSS